MFRFSSYAVLYILALLKYNQLHSWNLALENEYFLKIINSLKLTLQIKTFEINILYFK